MLIGKLTKHESYIFSVYKLNATVLIMSSMLSGIVQVPSTYLQNNNNRFSKSVDTDLWYVFC